MLYSIAVKLSAEKRKLNTPTCCATIVSYKFASVVPIPVNISPDNHLRLLKRKSLMSGYIGWMDSGQMDKYVHSRRTDSQSD